jgi:hypothetical protein
MQINIAGTGDKRTLTVLDGAEVLLEADGLKLKDAQDLARKGLREGWDTLKAKK